MKFGLGGFFDAAVTTVTGDKKKKDPASAAVSSVVDEGQRIYDDATGKTGRDRMNARAANEEAAEAQRLRDEETRLEQEEFRRRDLARTEAPQGRASTLLTGAQGVEDDEDLTLSRRRLMGF